MKKNIMLAMAGAAMGLLVTSAQAVDGGVNVGRHYTHLYAGLGETTPGLGLSAEWVHSEHNGSLAGVRAGYNVKLASLFISPGAKALYTNPKDGSDGYAMALGTGVILPVTKMVGVYGSWHYSPRFFAENIKRYQELTAGVVVSPVALLDIRAGYQYRELKNKDGRKDNVLADGPYVGAALHF